MSLLSGTCMTGDIWSSGVFSFESPLKDLLDSGDYTLEQLLAEDELLQEIRGVHPKLLEFFGTEHAVTGLVLYMIQSPHVDPQQLQQQHEQQQQEQQQDGATTTTATTTTIPAGPPNSLTQAMQPQPPPHATPPTEKEPGAWLLPEREDGDDDGHSRAAAATALQHQRYQQQQQQQLQQQMQEPLTPEEEYDLYHVRFPYMSCEVVCCEVNAVIDLLADGLVDPTVYEEEEEEEEEEGPVAPAELMVVAATPIVDADDATPPLLADAADADLPHESSLELEAIAPPTTTSTTTTTPAASDVPPSSSSSPPRRRRRRLLDLLFSVLFDTKPGDLDDYRAGYLEKIFSVLLRKRPQTLSDYINQGGEYGRVALQKAFVTHLYSHSIMQILQRLLLPASGSSNSNTNNNNNNNNNNNKGNKNGPNQQNQQQEDDEDDDLFADSSEDPYGNPDDSGNNGGGASTFRCTWGESTQVLELLLSSLLPTKEEVVAIAASASTKEELEDAEERRLCQSQHAAEVLMAIIQNSSLSSPLLEALLSDPALGRIVHAATTTIGDQKEDDNASSSSSHNNQTSLLSSWSPHDSLMTCALNVLESLILQLGGYGAAPPPPPPTTDQGEDKPPDYHRSKGRGGGGGSPGSSSTSSSSAASSALTLRTSTSGIGADPTSTLMEYLPLLLDAMSKLLRHSACDTWTSPMQFSTNKQHARKILGSSRLRIVRLLESLVLLGNTKVDDLLCQSNGLKICLELFWEFPWCSTLHQSVANLLVHIFEGANARGQLQEYFVVKCDLLRLLMDAFYESTATNHTSSGHVVVHAGAAAALTHPQHVVVNLNDEVPPAGGGGSAACTTSDPEDMIVSDEDIDAAIERQLEAAAAAAAHTGGVASAASSMMDKASMEALDPDSRDGSTALVDTPSQSVRLGYMGHVIIICQALVHACTKQQSNGAKDSKSDSIKKPGFRGLTAATARNWESKINGDHNAAAAAAATNLLPEKDEDDYGPRSKASSAASVESLQPLVLAQLIDSHPLKNRWNDFVVTTLASETSIQSTPLGGTTAVAVSTLESLHSSAHRPGRPDDDFLDDEAGGPRLPPRGLLANGEVIDMDDNDLDIAASMMAGLSLGRGMTPAPDRSMENGFENSSLHTRESMLGSALHKLSSGTYLFDDPLGGENHGFAHFDEDDNSSGASTMTGTEEDDRSRPEDDGVPVMDLFAGQFSFDSPAFSSNVPATAAENTFAADFANFDDAFTANFIAADDFPALVEEPPAAEVSSSSADNKPILEELFGGAKDHSILLEESLKEEQPTATAPSNDAPDPSGGGDGDDSSDEE